MLMFFEHHVEIKTLYVFIFYPYSNSGKWLEQGGNFLCFEEAKDEMMKLNVLCKVVLHQETAQVEQRV